MRKPHYCMPDRPNVTDQMIERQFACFNGLAERKGWQAAPEAAADQLAGIALWLGRQLRIYHFISHLREELN